ncbi:MAG: WD40 repeat domain-containing protein [Gemmataceae bacterium]
MSEESGSRWLRLGVPALGGLALLGGLTWWLSGEACRLVLGGHRGPVWAVAFSADGTRLATGGDGVRLWHLPNGGRLGTIDVAGKNVQALAFSPDGTLLSCGGADGILRLFDVNSQVERFQTSAHRGGVHAVAFTPDGKTLVSGGADKLIRLWDVASTRQRDVLRGHTGTVLALALSADGQTLASAGNDQTVRLWDLASRKSRVLRGHRQRVTALAFGGGQLASGDREGHLRLWDISGRELIERTAHDDRIVGLGWAGGRLVTAAENGELALWPAPTTSSDVQRWRQRRLSNAAAVAPDGSSVSTAGSDGRTRLWDLPPS